MLFWSLLGKREGKTHGNLHFNYAFFKFNSLCFLLYVFSVAEGERKREISIQKRDPLNQHVICVISKLVTYSSFAILIGYNTIQ